MKKIILILLMLLIALTLPGKVLTQLEELAKPQLISVSKDYFLITEGATIFVYSMKDHKLVKKFGKAGEGPKEFKINPFGAPMIAYFIKGKIYVNSESKMSWWTPTGEFISEKRTPAFAMFRPFGNHFVASGQSSNNKEQMVLTVNLHDSDGKKVRELYKTDITVGPNAEFNYPYASFTFEPYKDRLYLVRGTEGFVIEVKDISGKTLYTIKKEFEKIKVDQEYKDKTHASFKRDPNFKQFYEFFKNRIKFKTYYPAIQDVRVVDDRIHVITFKKKEGETECRILDLKGNDIKTVYVPYPDLHGMDYIPEYDILGKTFYILIENEDDEVWELHTKEL